MAEKKVRTAKKVVKATRAVKAKLAAGTAPAKKAVKAETGKVDLNVIDLDGKSAGKVSAPAELFAAKINKTLLAQAVRVYLANQREGGAATKTRGEVEGSTRKIYRQKGTGRARHGAIRAPIFVGGGITFGPVPHDFSLKLPQKMKRAALASTLTDKKETENLILVAGLNSITKTKKMVETLETIGAGEKPLLVVAKDAASAMRSARNIEGVEIMPANNLNTYSVISHQKIILMKETLPTLAETFIK